MLDDRTARFVLWAPARDAIALEIDEQPPIAMNRDEKGYFTAVAFCTPGTRYRFRVQPDLVVADPASRLQDGDVHDASILVGPDTYPWQCETWRGRPWHETVIYEIHPGICGGFVGIEASLPDLAKLGVTAIELMPIADFPGVRNWGYDGVLPYAPDTAYGAPNALKHMIDTAHSHGTMVFLDVVYNHFGPDSNYFHSFAPQFFRDDIKTPWGGAIDFRREPVRRYFIDNALYWLNEFRFDGLRFDAVHAIGDSEFLHVMVREIRANTASDRHIHLVLENDDNDATLLPATPASPLYDAQWADDTHHCLHVLLTGEQSGYYEDYRNPARQLARCLGEGFAYQGESSSHRDGTVRGAPSAHLPPSAFVAFLQNHDQIGNRAFGERLTMLADHGALRAAILLLLLSPQIPLIFMGEEYGETRPFLYFTDHRDPELAKAVRQGRRREFARFKEFASEEAQLRIPDPNDKTTFEVSILQAANAEDSAAVEWFAFYRHLLRLRHQAIVPGIPGARSIGAEALETSGVRAAWRFGNGAILTIAGNFGIGVLMCEAGAGAVFAATPPDVGTDNVLPPRAAIAWLQPA
ncbi:malto-oligosyltrehalose trehalohydrolase [Acidiphilium sp. AL]|uniref:malto-oligosyltrehalose trehalohydrolase n=1 Tax=Acidiphilium sp. AL TaxID=2871704 RepID=UPI0021CB1196|nr:malto-oligosyltrehalose trehalohydrolase [Acidiphilium sp. AL]MCU4158505.1 malto-oligosyltrehalose trehalohydrolase [Acidiphilium sp. AL]